MNINPNTPTIKWVVFKDFTQFENDARALMKHHQPYIPSGFPIEEITPFGTLIKQKFEQRGSRISFEMIDTHMAKLIEIMQDCLT